MKSDFIFGLFLLTYFQSKLQFYKLTLEAAEFDVKPFFVLLKLKQSSKTLLGLEWSHFEVKNWFPSGFIILRIKKADSENMFVRTAFFILCYQLFHITKRLTGGYMGCKSPNLTELGCHKLDQGTKGIFQYLIVFAILSTKNHRGGMI